MKQKEFYVIAVDFDGTLCEYDFPRIGKQNENHKKLLEILIKLKEKGHKLILWTCRGDNKEYPCLTEAINWCKDQGLFFDTVNENIPGTKKLSGPSPKVVADIYLDDRSLEFESEVSQFNSLAILQKL